MRYVGKMTGLSRTQVTRLVAQYMEHSEVKEAPYERHRFASRFTRGDIELLAEVDETHETLSGPATKRILEREYEEYKRTEYERLSSISVAHIYNLRQERHYRECFVNYTKTNPVKVAIGERRRPQPIGRPGYLRVDTVHQGDLEGRKGGVSHQRGGRGDAMASGGGRGGDLAIASDAGVANDTGAVSV